MALLGQGHSLRAACMQANISYYTCRVWLAKGGYTEMRGQKCPPHIIVEPYHSFAAALAAAIRTGRSVERPRNPTGPEPASLSATQRTRLLEGFTFGWSLRQIARHADVRHSTLLAWLHRGGYPKPVSNNIPIDPAFIVDPYKSFVADVLRAEDAFFDGEW